MRRISKLSVVTLAVLAAVAGIAGVADARISSNTFGASGQISAGGHRAQVTVLLACSDGSVRFSVTLQQGDTTGIGHGAGVCTAEVEEYVVTVTAGSARFDPGSATVCGTAVNQERAGTTDTAQWCRATPIALS